MNTPKSTSIDPQEVEKFSRIADEWWDLNGKFKPLHRLNPVRVEYIRSKTFLNRQAKENHEAPVSSLQGLSILDIGCGGGLLAEPMAHLGAEVTAIDASEKNIKVARSHAEKSKLTINYLCASAEELAATGAQFDIVLNMEVIEHVADVAGFMAASCQLVRPGGVMFIATLNRTLKSFALAIIGAEYVLSWLPRGTHDWENFLKPSEINYHLEKNSMRIEEMAGVTFNPLKNEWCVSGDVAVNYMMLAVKDE